jgi:hypothetical protein
MEILIAKQNDGPKEVHLRTPYAAYTIPEAACRLRMSEKSVRRQIIKGTLRRCKKFGRILIPARDVDTFFDRTV